MGFRPGTRSIVALALLVLTTGACGDTGGDGNGNTDVNPNQSVVGSWRGATTMGCFGEVSVEFVFSPNGTYSELTAFNELNCVPTSGLIHNTGNYEVVPSLGVIKLTNIDTEPKEQCLPGGGCVPLATVTSDALAYTMPDSNTLTLSCGHGCVITHTRVM